MLRNRLLTSIVLIPVVLGSVYLGGWWLFAIMGTGIILCGYEYFTLLKVADYQPERTLGIVLVIALLLDALLGWNAERVILIVLIVLPALWELRRREHGRFIESWALTALGVLYIGVLGAHLFVLRGLDDRGALLGITLMATWATDTAAFFAGTGLGRHPFYPEISPKKTWEGFIGGVLGAALAFGVLTSIFGINPLLAFLGGIGIGLAGTLGDLVESLLKRHVGVKDSGSLLAGHGGVLDRLDSMLFTVTFAYYFFRLVSSY